jgi:putative endonuclease
LDQSKSHFSLQVLALVMTFSVYILSNFGRTVFYTGVTNNLVTRMVQHRNNESKFTAKYKCHFLMYYEDYADIRNAIAREKQLKNWKRQWKIELIRKLNPGLDDLAQDWN